MINLKKTIKKQQSTDRKIITYKSKTIIDTVSYKRHISDWIPLSYTTTITITALLVWQLKILKNITLQKLPDYRVAAPNNSGNQKMSPNLLKAMFHAFYRRTYGTDR